MKKITKLLTGATLAAAFAVVFGVGGGSAFAATATWTGGATVSGTNDHKFSTGANWLAGTAPSASDDLVFDSTKLVSGAQGKGPILDVDVIVNNITFIGSQNDFQINGMKKKMIIGGNVISSMSGGKRASIYQANIALHSANVTFTDVDVSDDSVQLDLNGNNLTVNGSTDQRLFGIKITGNGNVTFDPGRNQTYSLLNTNNYTGTTTLLSGQALTTSPGGMKDSNTIYGTSSIVVGPSATLSIDAAPDQDEWIFSNSITIQKAVVGQSGFMEAQLYVWAGKAGQTIKIPHITIEGDARFDLNALGYDGAKVDLAGIKADGHCVQYGNESNTRADEFINGPTACVIGDDEDESIPGKVPGVPATAIDFIMNNPVVIVLFGLIIAAAAFTLIRVRQTND